MKKTIIFVLAVLVIAVMIYLVIPKYQIQSVRVDDDTVVVTKVNTMTGEITTIYPDNTIPRKYGKLQFIKK